jgi:hypothetical protein
VTSTSNGGTARPGRRALALLILAGTISCQGGAPASQAPDADVGTPQRPPRGKAALEAWLATAQYKSWTCEASIFPPRLNGNHGKQRICSNDLVLASTAGAYPVGAASVKELYTPDDAPNGFAVGVKIDPAAAPLAEGVAVPDCAVCHGLAGRDFVYIRAQ